MDRKHQVKWDIDHMRTVSCRVPTKAAAAFAEACRRNRTTRHRVLRTAVWQYIIENDVAAQFRLPDGPPEAR